MQYKKYALNLVIFASASDFDSIADEIVAKYSDKSPYELFSNFKLINEEQVTVLKDVDLKDKNAIIKALTDAEYAAIRSQIWSNI